MSKPFESYTFEDASALIGAKALETTSLATSLVATNPRRPAEAISATKYFNRDHWQNTAGFIGNLPPASYPGSSQITADIKKRFTSENVIQEVVETHTGGILGREPLWSFLKEQGTSTKKKESDDATGELVTQWWNEREALKDLQKSVEIMLCEGAAVRRMFFPKGRLLSIKDEETGQTETVVPGLSDIPQALDFIYFETHTADVAGVFTDPDSQKQIGIFLFDEKDENGDVVDNCAELSFLNEEGDTVCRIVRDKGATEEVVYRLGGRLLLHEMKRRPLITDQVQSMQRAINAAHTAMLQNVNMAGARERAVTNAQNPKRAQRRQNPNNPAAEVETLESATYETGGGAVMFLMGYPIRNDKGDIVGYTNPNVNITDPAPVDVFQKTRDHYYAAILGQCHQRHILISGDATASGVSRQQAEKAYQRSLKDTKTVVDACGRWQLETALRLAAQLCNKSEQYLNLRADFNCLLDVGEPSPDELRVIMELRKPDGRTGLPLISDETARNKIGIEDAAAELKRIEEEKPAEPPSTSDPPPNPDDVPIDDQVPVN